MTDKIELEGGLRVRQGVIIVLQNAASALLAGNRRNTGYWQLPQGGRQSGDAIADALREMGEELGVAPAEVRFERVLPKPTLTVLPEAYRKCGFDAQRHTWVLFRYLPPGLPDLDRATDKEFSALQWVDRDWLLQKAQEFRVKAYTQMLDKLELRFVH